MPAFIPSIQITDSDLERARGDRLGPGELADVLARHRAGDLPAGKRLRDAFAYLVLEKTLAHGSGDVQADELLTSWYLDLATAIDNLADNAVDPAGVESFIRSHLYYTEREYLAETSANITVPYSTNGSRRKRGAEPYAALKRVLPAPDQHHESLTEHPETARMTTNTPMRPQQDQQIAIAEAREEHDSLMAIARSPLERTIVGLLMVGHTEIDIAKDTFDGVTKKQIKSILARLRRRAGLE